MRQQFGGGDVALVGVETEDREGKAAGDVRAKVIGVRVATGGVGVDGAADGPDVEVAE